MSGSSEVAAEDPPDCLSSFCMAGCVLTASSVSWIANSKALAIFRLRCPARSCCDGKACWLCRHALDISAAGPLTLHLMHAGKHAGLPACFLQTRQGSPLALQPIQQRCCLAAQVASLPSSL